MASETFADELRAAVAGDKFTLYTELMLQAAELLDHKDEQINTRPAPAATDTGLETVGNITEECLLELKQMLCGEIHPCNDIGDVTDADIELVTRSQAEELLAAEIRRERDLAEKQLSEVVDRMSDDYLALKADNAALTARIEGLEKHCELLCDPTIIRLEKENSDLEAKLAAAEQALEPFSDHANDQAVDDTGWRDKETVKIVVSIGDLRKARAVLGGKPS